MENWFLSSKFFTLSLGTLSSPSAFLISSVANSIISSLDCLIFCFFFSLEVFSEMRLVFTRFAILSVAGLLLGTYSELECPKFEEFSQDNLRNPISSELDG